ncbi:MAG: phage gp6-like head-tail connector protein [bacterium]
MPWAPPYVTTAQLRAYLRISDVVDDAEIALAVESASRAIDHAANRQFGLVAATEAREYTARFDRGLQRWVTDIDDLANTTGLVVESDNDDDGIYGDDTWVLDTDYTLHPPNALDRPWTLVVFRHKADRPTTNPQGIRVTGNFGWSAVPRTIEQVTLLQASRIFTRRNSPYGISGSPDLGGELRLLARVDPDVEVALRPYRRVWGAV